MKKFVSILLFISGLAYSQDDLPTDYFSNPMEIDLILSGSFGELRSNHFHSGLDIKTKQRVGQPIFAPADGYVSRINVGHFGYGKALYILHPNGYTTVYGHLRSYAGDIEKYVKDRQYQKETYEIKLFPEKTHLPIKKGDLIAYSGNSGGSGGPHLHYEIRDAAQRPMNPLLFGIDVPDSKTPIVSAVFAYPIGEDAHVNQDQNRIKLRLIKQRDGNYKTEDIKAYGKIGFGVTTYDQWDGASNKNGSYKIETRFNGSEKFEVQFNKFSFSETRYLNRYLDYEYWETNKSRVQKLFREQNNPLSVITKTDDNGYVTIKDSLHSIYSIAVSDFKGNRRFISIPIEGSKSEILTPRNIQKTEDFIYADHSNSITKGKFSIFIPTNSLYENTYLDIKNEGDTLIFHEDIIPIHTNITITADVSAYSEVDRDKLYLGRLNYKGLPYYSTTRRVGDKLTTKTRTFGTYVIASDTIPPEIKPINFSEGKWISNENYLKLKITDDLSGISAYRATINGKFILMEYDYKKDVLTYNFNDNVNLDSENNLKVIVTDNVGNSTTFEAKFFRKHT
ncbi:M23 family metallopeptidase [Aequorivita marina]|uniref:M23 family metallopeptidase n=1 Tax=Aequorivita marina TaxID=3073654 RepID=UPI002875486B|nr:M23 family metallopeptidase [Aequorivita sp. S2608]MDS1297529.1 M23 family metallopeptidase [Aequorivita sp. S2608]